MLIIPLQPVPSQLLTVSLAGQICTITVFQKLSGLYMDLTTQDSGPDGIVNGVLCQNLNRIVRDAYLGFTGDFTFIDSQGKDDPVYTGLGARFNLAYLETTDLLPGEA